MTLSGRFLSRKRRHARIRKKILGTPERPRLSVYRGLKNIRAQLVDDTTGSVVAQASTLDKEIKGSIKYGGNAESAKIVGELLGKRAKEKGIGEIVFDRGGCLYHGRIKALAESARKAGLNF